MIRPTTTFSEVAEEPVVPRDTSAFRDAVFRPLNDKSSCEL